MIEETRKRGLGRGLSALLGDDGEDYTRLEQVRATREVPIESLEPNRYQPRQRFDDGELNELVDSIREIGVLQPILVRKIAGADDSYEIVAGERRWRAAQRAHLHHVPVVIKDLDDTQSLKIALVENIQREDLSAIEEADGYSRLMEEFNLTQEDVARAVGKSRSHVANTVRLLGLPDAVKEMMLEGAISAGHGRALLVSGDPEGLAQRIVEQGLTVRQVEEIVRGPVETHGKDETKTREGKDASTRELERDLTRATGMRVTISHRGEGGSVKIDYKTLEQLDDLCRRLAHHFDNDTEMDDEDPWDEASDTLMSDLLTSMESGDPTDGIVPQTTAANGVGQTDGLESESLERYHDLSAEDAVQSAINSLVGGDDSDEDPADSGDVEIIRIDNET
jgi:ParB family chromosome partitioning protein